MRPRETRTYLDKPESLLHSVVEIFLSFQSKCEIVHGVREVGFKLNRSSEACDSVMISGLLSLHHAQVIPRFGIDGVKLDRVSQMFDRTFCVTAAKRRQA